jgi:aryl-alcohol dehydrogenase-like predicted oxidoreductase
LRTRPLGKTGLVVSELSLGTWGLSGDAYGAVDAAEAENVVTRAVDIGVNLIDTADAYGGGAMEAMLGRALALHPGVYVVTKGGTDRATSPPRKRFDEAYLRVAVQRSLKRLKRDCIDVYLLHNPSLECVRGGAATHVMEALKKEGLIAHWGVAAGDMDIGRAAIDAGAEVIELAYNLFQASDLHRLSGDIMVSKVGVLARSVLSYGLLAATWSREHEFAPGDHRAERWTRTELAHRIDQLDVVRFLQRGDVSTMRAAAVRFVLAQELVGSAILGPRTEAQLVELIRETGSGPRYLPDHDVRALPFALESVGIAT